MLLQRRSHLQTTSVAVRVFILAVGLRRRIAANIVHVLSARPERHNFTTYMLGMRLQLWSRSGPPLTIGRVLRSQPHCGRWRSFSQPASASAATQQQEQRQLAQRAADKHSSLRRSDSATAPQSGAKHAVDSAVRTAGQRIIEDKAAKLGVSTLLSLSLLLASARWCCACSRRATWQRG